MTNGQPFSFGDFQLNTRNGMGVDALKAGVNPRDPAQWQAADKFALDQMKAGGVGPWKGDPVAAAYLKSSRAEGDWPDGSLPPRQAVPGPQDARIDRQSPIPSTPSTTINSTPAAAPRASARDSERSSPRT